MENSTTKVKNKINWLKATIDNTAKGQVNQKVNEILQQCGISKRTFYRWVQTGLVPKPLYVNIICNVLNLNQKTRVNTK